MSRNMHKYEELTPYEFNQEKERASIIYVAAGPVEYHEECNALGIDPCKGYEWCLDAAEITGGIVFPMLPVAPAGKVPFATKEQIQERYDVPHFTDEYQRLPGTYPGVFFGREVCYALYKELLDALALEMKFKLCVFFGAHGPAGWMIKEIVKEEQKGAGELQTESGSVVGEYKGMQVMVVGSTDYNRDLIQDFYAKNEISRINHGGLWEAAINYAINPEYFQPELLDAKKYPQHYGALQEEHTEGCVRPVLSEYRKFTPEFAEQLYHTTAQRFAADVQEKYRQITEG